MLARVFSCARVDLDGVIVQVAIDSSRCLPGRPIVRLPYVYHPGKYRYGYADQKSQIHGGFYEYLENNPVTQLTRLWTFIN